MLLIVARFSLEANEHVTAMKVMLLRSLETMSGRKEYIVMGTTYICSEDTSNIGKVCPFYVMAPHKCFILDCRSTYLMCWMLYLSLGSHSQRTN